MTTIELLSNIYKHIKSLEENDDVIAISFDCDHKSAEILIDFKDNTHEIKNLVISTEHSL